MSEYLRLSICARNECTAGPFPLFNILDCKKLASAVFPISPPSASISLTRCPFAVPPIDGLQGQLPTESIFIVKITVLQPSLDDASAASIPA